MASFLPQATEKQEETIALIQSLVECESPSGDPAAIRRIHDLLIHSTGKLAKPKIVKNNLRLEFNGTVRRGAPQILVLAHADTVWEHGTLKTMPYRRDKHRLWGPGVLDMKAGIAFFVTAMRILYETDAPRVSRIVMLVVSDEEIGSPQSRALIEAEARRSHRVLVLEPGTGLEGKLKTARKGVGAYRLQITGKAAHAGVDFENGASAILEAGRQLEKLASLTNLKQGITINPGLVKGGTRPNVVAAEATIDIDIRVARLQDFDRLKKKLQVLRPVDKRCQLAIDGTLNRPPMERTREIADLYRQAKQIGKTLGVEIQESSSGGGSDGNFTAALGVPTLDGLGAVGEGAHAPNESILVSRIPDRVALLASLATG